MSRKALISTIEPRDAGLRVVQVEDASNIFEVHSSLIWIDCDDTIQADKFWYDRSNNTFIAIPEPEREQIEIPG